MSVEKIIADHLKVDISEVTDDKHIIDDLGGDSLHTVELVLEVKQSRVYLCLMKMQNR